MVEFFLILSAITAVPARVFWKLLIGTTLMLVFGYLGEAGYAGRNRRFRSRNPRPGYTCCMEIFKGEAGQLNAENASPAVQSAFQPDAEHRDLRLGDLSARLFDGLYDGQRRCRHAEHHLYDLADVLNKIAFGLIIWHVAVTGK